MLQTLIPSLPWTAPPCPHPGTIQGKEGIKFCNLATLPHMSALDNKFLSSLVVILSPSANVCNLPRTIVGCMNERRPWQQSAKERQNSSLRDRVGRKSKSYCRQCQNRFRASLCFVLTTTRMLMSRPYSQLISLSISPINPPAVHATTV